jgi:uncharacterized cupin superfamily protein
MIIRRTAVPIHTSESKNWGRIETQRMGDAGGITQFGASVQTLSPGAKGSVRHWHEHVDEMILVLSGEVTVTENDGPHTLHVGDCACWPAGVANGHTLDNRSAAPATILVMGTRGLDDAAIYVEDADAALRNTR